jgi:hypothetical protein
MGIAQWLKETVKDLTGSAEPIVITNAGTYFAISTPATITPEQIEDYYTPLGWIATEKTGPPPPGAQLGTNYEQQRRANTEYFEALKQLRKEGLTEKQLPAERKESFPAPPPPAWSIAAIINQMGALNAYNKAVSRWAACRNVYPDLVALIWTMCSGQPHALEAAEAQWVVLAKQHDLEKKATLPATQVVNPEQGKGANRAKADKLDIGGQDNFWLLEYFKFVGLYQSALPRTVQGQKDRKTYILLPSREGISTRWYDQAFSMFQKEFWPSSAIKMDIQAILHWTRIMLEVWEGAQYSSGRRRRISDYVDGFAVASFKDLGSAVAVMNIATLRLPDWVEWPASAERARALQEVVEHHRKLIGALEEKHSEAERLLRHYRNFLSSRDPALTAFFDFTTGYAEYVMSKMYRRQSVRRLTIEDLEVIVMSHDDQREHPLEAVVHNEGFRNIAKAIRRSTVVPQYQKVIGDTPYDVHYGLANDLRRKSRTREAFLPVLCEFMQQYNQENKRVFARAKRARADITTNDITELMQLLDLYGTPLIANLLIAFGYARDAKPAEQDDTSADDTPDPTNDQPTDDTPDTEFPF